jgi:exodeoxyribonuclease V alpha subunit
MSDEVAVLAPFVDAGVLEGSEVHLAELIARTVPGVEPEVLLGAALAARAPRLGHVCVVIRNVASSVVFDGPADSLPWPKADRWAKILASSPAVRGRTAEIDRTVRPLVWDGTRLYLERYWRFEERVADELLRRCSDDDTLAVTSPKLSEILERLFDGKDDAQREAAARALTRPLTVIAGGPGTGKTTTIAMLLAAGSALGLERGQKLGFALAAPTGKAAARMQAAVRASVGDKAVDELGAQVSGALLAAEGKTLHRLLGIASGGAPRHDRSHPLPQDIVIVDETSMVSLPLMAQLLEAVRPDAAIVLVGDPFQLVSVEAGAVLGDIVGPKATGAAEGPLGADVVLLENNHRSSASIKALATQIRLGDFQGAMELLGDNNSDEIAFVSADDQRGVAQLHEVAAGQAGRVVDLARAGSAKEAISCACELKVLCATRFGPLGVSGWTLAIEALLKGSRGHGEVGGRRYVGRPVIVTRNDYLNKLFNGDVGLIVAGPNVAFEDATGGVRMLTMSQLSEVDTWWATTIHKSQGSEFDHVIVSLPPAPSPVLTRELLYTAVTRARSRLSLVASESSVRAAIENPVARASGLRTRLWRKAATSERDTPWSIESRQGTRQLRFDL